MVTLPLPDARPVAGSSLGPRCHQSIDLEDGRPCTQTPPWFRTLVESGHLLAGEGLAGLKRNLARTFAMEIRKFSLERYKGYAEATEVELAPLTILIGANNSGKTALAKAFQLLAGGLVSSGKEPSEPLPLESGDIYHGRGFEDLVTGRTVHGRVSLSVTLNDNGSDVSLSVTVRNVESPTRPSERQISDWILQDGSNKIVLRRQGFDERSTYDVFVSGTELKPQQIEWRGLVPGQPDNLASWVRARVGSFNAWAFGVRHLPCPRSLLESPFTSVDHPPLVLGPNGRDAPLVLAADDDLRESVREWYRRAFGVSIDVAAQGSYSELVIRASSRDADVRLLQSGRGLSHVLPVVVTALTTRRAGPGVDVIEHPEAELHPAAHADIVELLLDNLAGPVRPMIVETHSEMVLLRARRWIAEGRLPADHVLVYWVHTESGRGSILQKIRISENGEMESWPDGVFVEDYEEILAIRRAARPKG